MRERCSTRLRRVVDRIRSALRLVPILALALAASQAISEIAPPSELVPAFLSDPPWLEMGGLDGILASRELADGRVLLASPQATVLLDPDGAAVGGARLLPQLGGLGGRLLAIDPFGAVFVAGVGFGTSELYLMKYDGRSGRGLWEGPRRLGESLVGYDLQGMGVDPAGEPILLLQELRPDASTRLVVLGLRGSTGEPRWGPTVLIDGSYQESSSMTFDPWGSVLVAFTMGEGSAAAKLAGATGELLWGPLSDPSVPANAPLRALSAATDPVTGDLIYLTVDTVGSAYLSKRNAGTGSLVWGPALVDGTGAGMFERRVIVDADGDALTLAKVPFTSSPGLGRVCRFEAATGKLRWGPVFTSGVPEAWALDADGDLFVAHSGGRLDGFGRDGSLLWRREEAPPALGASDQPASTVVLSRGRLLHVWRENEPWFSLRDSLRDPSSGDLVSGPLSADVLSSGFVWNEQLLRLPGGPFVVAGLSADPAAGGYRTVVYASDVISGDADWGPTWLPPAYSSSWKGYRPLCWAWPGGLSVAGSKVLGIPSEVQVESLRADGTVRWGPVTLSASAGALQPVDISGDAEGNTFVLGNSADGAELYRLASATGTTDVHLTVPGILPWALVVRTDGDPILAGSDSQGFVVARCAMEPGHATWIAHGSTTPGSAVPRLLLDGHGDLVLVTRSIASGQQALPLILKLDGTSGALLWGPVVLTDLFLAGELPEMSAVLDPSGDVIVGGNLVAAGTSRRRVGIVKLSGGTGTRIWGPSTSSSGQFGSDTLSYLATTSTGEVVIAMRTTAGGSPVSTSSLVRFDGASGILIAKPFFLPFSPVGLLVDGDRLFISAGGRVVGYRLDGLGISALSLPSGSCGLPYTAHLDARNGATPLSHELVSGSLPPGLTLDPASGEIAGTPTATGAWPFRVSVRDAGAQEVSRSFTIEVVPATDLVLPPPPALCPGESAVLTAPPGFAQYRWLRDGETSQVVTVSPEDATTYGFEATDGNGCAHQGAVRVEVVPDRRPPDVLAPDPVVLRQTGCSGGKPIATAATSSPLAAFLSGGAGFETCGPGVLRLPPQVSGADVTDATTFAAGVTTVAFRFADVAGNVGQASSTVTVQAYGDLDGNARLDVFDGVILASYLVGNVVPGSAPFTGPAFAADVNGDGSVDVFDLVTLVSYVVGNVPCLGGHV